MLLSKLVFIGHRIREQNSRISYVLATCVSSQQPCEVGVVHRLQMFTKVKDPELLGGITGIAINTHLVHYAAASQNESQN